MPASADTQASIERLLGRLEAQIDAIRQDMAETKSALFESDKGSTESRRRIFERVEQIAGLVSKLEGEVRVVGVTAAQARDASSHTAQEVMRHSERLDRHIRVVTPTVRKMRMMELRLGSIVGVLVVIGGGLWWLIQNNFGAIWNFIARGFGWPPIH